MPVGVIGCISFVTIIYMVMALVLVMMVPSNTLDESAAFAVAFEQAGFVWGRYLVAAGAVLGTLTGTLVGLMGVARLICCLCRSHIGLPLFGRVNAKRGTPMWATALTMLFCAPFALLTDLPALIDMCSAAALAAFAVVAIAHLFKRWMPRKQRKAGATAVASGASTIATPKPSTTMGGKDADAAVAKALAEGGATTSDGPFAEAPGADEAIKEGHQGRRAGMVIAVIVILAAGFGIAWGLTEGADGLGWISIIVMVVAAYAVTAYGACTLKKLDVCQGFEAPAFPWLPVTSLLLDSFLMASLSGRAYCAYVFWREALPPRGAAKKTRYTFLTHPRCSAPPPNTQQQQGNSPSSGPS
jgi:amino acid transporter